jgi:hypothetical protein
VILTGPKFDPPEHETVTLMLLLVQFATVPPKYTSNQPLLATGTVRIEVGSIEIVHIVNSYVSVE